MTNEEAIESFKHSNKQAKVHLEVQKMRMDSGEIKELEFYIERNEMAIKALETIPKYKDAYNKGYEAGVKATNVDCGVVWEERIDAIKAEIEAKAKEREFYLDSGHPYDGLYEALKIIDKHCGGDNE